MSAHEGESRVRAAEIFPINKEIIALGLETSQLERIPAVTVKTKVNCFFLHVFAKHITELESVPAQERISPLILIFTALHALAIHTRGGRTAQNGPSSHL